MVIINIMLTFQIGIYCSRRSCVSGWVHRLAHPVPMGLPWRLNRHTQNSPIPRPGIASFTSAPQRLFLFVPPQHIFPYKDHTTNTQTIFDNPQTPFRSHFPATRRPITQKPDQSTTKPRTSQPLSQQQPLIPSQRVRRER